ncbi:MAG: hypothetical protein ACOVSW_17475 [Candidatus Kapaibacteriota bacterium]
MNHIDSEFATIEWNASAQAVQLAYKETSSAYFPDYSAQPSSMRNELRHVLETTLDLAKEYSSVNIIGDMSNLLLLTNEDEQWSLHNWLPRLQEAGVRNMAIIPPHTLIGKLSLDVLMRQMQGINIQRVSSIAEAQYWLKEQRN